MTSTLRSLKILKKINQLSLDELRQKIALLEDQLVEISLIQTERLSHWWGEKELAHPNPHLSLTLEEYESQMHLQQIQDQKEEQALKSHLDGCLHRIQETFQELKKIEIPLMDLEDSIESEKNRQEMFVLNEIAERQSYSQRLKKTGEA